MKTAYNFDPFENFRRQNNTHLNFNANFNLISCIIGKTETKVATHQLLSHTLHVMLQVEFARLADADKSCCKLK